jgi:bifunctional non-homologous end joining protein LigD
MSDIGHVTKGELAEYYAAMAPRILPQVVRHPLSLLRCPSEVDKQCFFQRNPGRGLGADVRSFEFWNEGKTYEYLYVEDERGLLEVVQISFETLKLGAQDLR